MIGFAGLRSVRTTEDQTKLFTCCIITTVANELVAPSHDRMPAILAPDDDALGFGHDAPLKDVHAPEAVPRGTDGRERSQHAGQRPQNEGPKLLDPAG